MLLCVTLILFTSSRSAIFPESCSNMQTDIYTLSEHRWHSARLFLNIKIKYIVTKRGCRCTPICSSDIKKKSPNVTKVTHPLPYSSGLHSNIDSPVYVFTHVPRHPQLTYGNALTEVMLVSWPGCTEPFSDICTTPSDWRRRPGAPFTVMGGSGRSTEEVKYTSEHSGAWRWLREGGENRKTNSCIPH